MRQIALDTETTGIKIAEGHRIIEIGCVEILHRRVTNNRFHCYLQPDRLIEQDASAIHGITNEFLEGKPRFIEVADELMAFIKDAELVIHNAEFDVGFINNELQLLNQQWQPLAHYCHIIDTLKIARSQHPGQKNSLDALCKRYEIDNSQRQLHGALLDAELLAEVYLAMTGGQSSLLPSESRSHAHVNTQIKRISADRMPLVLIQPTPEELEAHQQRLAAINKASKGECLWMKYS